ncbi:Dak1 domain-containing protein [Lipomyces arxii]|uniref:Dak1 domain-containing protein n=1 Tax=Lipomyces arxii TaxID=56418 RepID=UPI0034CF25C0
MSTKHFFADAPSLVIQHLQALVAANPSLTLIPEDRVIYDAAHDPNTVSLISGGGSGHEPAWSGLVGSGLLAAVANGPIFGSPSAKQILKAIDSAPSAKGVLLIITNYTGDKLHFGLACEKAKAKYASVGIPFAVLPCTDDVALGRKRTGMVGRRGLAGNVIILKVLGGAAITGMSFGDLYTLGAAVNTNLVTIGSSLDHCHVPGRQNHETLSEDVCILGMGIHNEPGLRKLSPLPSAQDLLAEMIAYLVDPNDEDRAYVSFNDGDEVAMLINNFGGLSALETGALTFQALVQLEKWNIKPSRVFSGSFESSLNGPGFSISLCNLTNVGKETGIPTATALEYLDAPTTAPSWPHPYRSAKPVEVGSVVKTTTNGVATADFEVDSVYLDKIIRTACNRAVAAEPDLTRWDMIMGDGDCGDGVKAVSLDILKVLDRLDSGSLLTALNGIMGAVDDMGGTLGAIFGILLAALVTSVTKRAASKVELTVAVWGECAKEALDSLKSHTGARVGDRTCMDVLIPFCETLNSEKTLGAAVAAAKKAADGTRGMKPRFGRATYVTTAEGDIPPDPGAWAVYEMVQGLLDATE